MHNNHNYLYYGDPGVQRHEVKCGGLPLCGQLRSMTCRDGPSIAGEGNFELGARAKAFRVLGMHNNHNCL